MHDSSTKAMWSCLHATYSYPHHTQSRPMQQIHRVRAPHPHPLQLSSHLLHSPLRSLLCVLQQGPFHNNRSQDDSETVHFPIRLCMRSLCVCTLGRGLAEIKVNNQHIVTRPTLTLSGRGEAQVYEWTKETPVQALSCMSTEGRCARVKTWICHQFTHRLWPLFSHLSSPPPPSHRCTLPGHASASAVACPRHAAGSSGDPCHIGASRRHSAPL